MAYQCPRCGGPVQRGYSAGAQMAAGLLGALFTAAFGSFQCRTCGAISRGEFPPQDRERMTAGSVFLALGGVALLVVVLCLIGK